MPHSPLLNSRRTAIAGAVMLLISSSHSTARVHDKARPNGPSPQNVLFESVTSAL